MDDRELATVLAALRLWQTISRKDGLDDIATDGGKFVALTNSEIDKLCERLNTG